MSKFITPVSMQVTQEQYDKDLKQALLDLGYKEDKDWNRIFKSHDKYYILCSGGIYAFYSSIVGKVFCIDHHNPKLFLALAAMKEGNKFHVGEYVWIKEGTSADSKKHDGTIKKIVKTRDGYLCVEDGEYGVWESECRKATKEELIEYFSHEKFYLIGIDPAMEGHLEMLEEVEKIMKIESIKKKVPQKTTLPDGSYVGTYSGYVITIEYRNETYEIAVDEGIRGLGKVIVTIEGKSINVKDLKN